MARETLVFRCDANRAIGTGHVMRCLALAEAWQDAGGSALFATAELPAGLEARLRAEAVALTTVKDVPGAPDDADTTIRLAQQAGAGWVVVDGDRFGVDFLQRIRESGVRVFLVDDFARRESFPADLILNPNIGASEDDYRGLDGKVPLLLGSPYTLLRREFTSWQAERSLASRGASVLVTLGGSDPENLAPRIARAFAGCKSTRVTVIAGAGYEHLDELKAVSGDNICAVFNPPNMTDLMHAADVAVTAAGGTLWELLYMRCAVLSYSRNPVQARVVRLVSERGAVVDLGDVDDFDAKALVAAIEKVLSSQSVREDMAIRGRQLADGRGATRVLEAVSKASRIRCGTVSVR